MSFKEKDFLLDMEIKVINNPLITEELKAVLNGEPTNNKQAKYFAELIQNGLVSKESAVKFVERMVAIEENAAAQLESIWGQ